MAVYCAALNINDAPHSNDSAHTGIDFRQNRQKNRKGNGLATRLLSGVIGPLLGLAYITFTPVIMICAFGYLVFSELAWKPGRKLFFSKL
ncbi:MAG: hypothetical protein V1932_04060 [Chloroflexota bacterium]